MRTRKTKPAVIQSLIEAGNIKTERANPKDRYPTVGYDAQRKLWYAWNDKVYNSFGIGSRVNVGNCAYTKERGAWQAMTVKDAKQMAIDFARGVA